MSVTAPEGETPRPRYPLHLDLAGRRVLVVGGGSVAVRRVRALLAAGADVRVVAPRTAPDLPDVPVARREFADTDLDGAWLVHTCTGTVDDRVAAVCATRRIWCVRADDATVSAAWVPATARVDDVVVSVTAGRDPRRAVRLRDALALALQTGDLPMRRSRPGAGSVSLVRAASEDPDLLTVRGRRLLAGADVVVRDEQAPRLPLPGDVEVVEAGPAQGAGLLVEHAARGRRVVRLLRPGQSADAEIAACAAAGVPVHLVPPESP